MLHKESYIQSIVALLFMSAWMLQSFSPVVLQYISSHSAEMAVCNMEVGNAASCSVEGGQMNCSCNHNAADSEGEDPLTLCGCTHHGSEPVGTASPFQIKAPLPAIFSYIHFSFSIINVSPVDSYENFSTDDIFRPPRLSA